MSWLGDNLNFEAFQLKDLWKNIKHQPGRLLYGSVDPFNTKVMNGILGRHDTPLIDSFGGPFNGKAISWNNEGGVYDRAKAQGINTGPASGMHKAAKVIVSLYGLGALQGHMGGGQGGQGGNNFPTSSGQQQQQDPQQYDMPTYQDMPDDTYQKLAMLLLNKPQAMGGGVYSPIGNPNA